MSRSTVVSLFLLTILSAGYVCGESPYWQSRPGGCAGMQFEFPPPSDPTGYESMEFTWSFPIDPGRSIRDYPIPEELQGAKGYLGYYWANQFGFTKKGSGYFGLQTVGMREDAHPDPRHRANPARVRRLPNDRIAIFSIWNALDGRKAGPGSSAAPFGHEGSGWSCKVVYPWTSDVPYRLRVRRLDEGETREGAQAVWWRASVTDTITTSQVVIGDILIPSEWGGLGRKPGMFAEYYAQTVSANVGAEDAGKPRPRVCDYLPKAAIRIDVPTANGHTEHPVPCTRIRVNPYGKCAHVASFRQLDETLLKKGTRMKAEPVICVTGTLQKSR